jgi:DNA (cytosine-5)-methyltransferase 1
VSQVWVSVVRWGMICGVGTNRNYQTSWQPASLPAPTIMTAPAKEGGAGWLLSDERIETLLMADKPPYRIPLMSEIAALPWNGLMVVSTFSGCGGSCLGYRMAGYRVLWANEFVPVAQASYKANADLSCLLDGRDIKQVQPIDILQATGLQVGELDLFDGSPPCQAFSTAGKRHKGWGTNKRYEHGAQQKNEALFDEYIRLLRGLQPKVFVAENVSGLVKGVAKGFFLQILRDLKASGYQVEARLLDAQWLGVPQMRQRIIFVGVRTDLAQAPVFPKPLPYRYSVREALSLESADSFNQHAGSSIAIEPETDIARYAIGLEWDKLKLGEQSTRFFSLVKPALDTPVSTIQASHGSASIASVVHPLQKRKFTIAEVKRLCAFPDDFILKGSYAQQWERLGNSVPPVMMMYIAQEISTQILQPV